MNNSQNNRPRPSASYERTSAPRRPINNTAPQPQRRTQNPTPASRPVRNSNFVARPRPNQNPRPPQQRSSRPTPTPPLQHHGEPKMKIVRRYSAEDKRFFVIMAITAALAVALICGMIIFAVNRATGSAENKGDNGPDTSSALLTETPDMGQSYIDSLIFVGDSNTAHMRSFAVLSGGKDTNQVWATESQTLTLDSEITQRKIIYPETGELMTIADAAALKKPKYLVISLGTNGVAFLTKENFKKAYTKLLDAIKEASPDTKIMVQSIYPVTASYDKIPNEKITQANEWLLELASEESVKYLDTASVLRDSNGYLSETYNSYHKDGYHINTAAYLEILKYIRTHGWQ